MSTSPDTPNTEDTHAFPPKLDPKSMALRAAPRAVTRLNRRMFALIAVLVCAFVLGCALWSLRTPVRVQATAAESYNVERVTRAEALEQLPKDYSKVPLLPAPPASVPVLGEPLPGDIGAAMAHPHGSVGTSTYGAAAPAQQMALAHEAEEIARSPVFFSISNKPPAESAPAAPDPAAGTFPAAPFNPLPSATVPLTAGASDATALQNRQDQKTAFAERTDQANTRNRGNLQLPSSPYLVTAGTTIPAALVTGINSDLPGMVIASVTETIRDSATGRFTLIPQGSRLIGRYDSQVAYGQRRVLLVWTRIVLPDTSSIELDRLPGVDPAGYAGLEDGVDWHWDRILAGAAISTLLGVGAEVAAPESRTDGNQVVVAARTSVQDTVNQVGQEITKRNLNVQPTLTIRPGFSVRVMVHKDLVLRPYQPLFFSRGAPQ
jgi:type IV secretion system protein TrbI